MCGVLVFGSLCLLPPHPPPLCHTPSFTHHLSHTIFVTHHLSRTHTHTSLSHTIFHTHLCLTPSLSHTSLSHTIFRTHLCLTPSLSHTHTIFRTPSFTHHRGTWRHRPSSHTIFHTQHCHTPSFTHDLPHTVFVTHHLSHTSFTDSPTSFCVAGMALMALGWLWWRAWSPLVARDAAPLCVAGVALGNIHRRFRWHSWHLATSSFVLPGRRGTYDTWLGLATRFAVNRPWHCATLRGRRGTWRHPPSFHVVGVAFGNIQLRFAWQAWHLWHYAGSGGALGPHCSKWEANSHQSCSHQQAPAWSVFLWLRRLWNGCCSPVWPCRPKVREKARSWSNVPSAQPATVGCCYTVSKLHGRFPFGCIGCETAVACLFSFILCCPVSVSVHIFQYQADRREVGQGVRNDAAVCAWGQRLVPDRVWQQGSWATAPCWASTRALAGQFTSLRLSNVPPQVPPRNLGGHVSTHRSRWHTAFQSCRDSIHHLIHTCLFKIITLTHAHIHTPSHTPSFIAHLLPRTTFTYNSLTVRSYTISFVYASWTHAHIHTPSHTIFHRTSSSTHNFHIQLSNCSILHHLLCLCLLSLRTTSSVVTLTWLVSHKIFTRNIVTHHLCHTPSLSHTIFHTQL